MKLKNYMNEAIRLKEPTADKINQLAKNPEIKKYARKIVMYQKNDPGYGLARISAVNVMNDFILALGSAYEKGKPFNIDKEYKKKKYQKVTNPFNDWIIAYAKEVHKHLYGK